ncbi:hypothetical protein JQX13_18200 [Archangium violaceum]|nr:hypothetical protein JQX13_18200 [Archangium violaceum]
MPERVHATFTRFQQCRECRRVFWAGSHHTRMQVIIDKLRELEQHP